MLGPTVDRLHDRPLTAALLDGVNAAALGLMTAVAMQLGLSAVRDAQTIGLFLASGAALNTPLTPH